MFIVGVPAFNSTDGKYYVLLDTPANVFGGVVTWQIRKLYDVNSIASVVSYGGGMTPNKQTPFCYDNKLWFIKNTSDKKVHLCNVDLTSGAETDVVVLYTSSGDQNWFDFACAFDGTSTVYVLNQFRQSVTDFGYTVNKYDIATTTLTNLRTVTSGGGIPASVRGIGVAGSTLYFCFTDTAGGGVQHYCTMTTGGASFTQSGAITLTMLGFHGNAVNSAKQIYVQGAQVYACSDTPLVVFILEDGTAAQLKFAGFFGDGTYFYYEEIDGTSGSPVVKYKSASLGALANLPERGVYPFRSDLGLESAIGAIISGGYSNYFEAPSNMKETI
jgi:hypothetical protein